MAGDLPDQAAWEVGKTMYRTRAEAK